MFPLTPPFQHYIGIPANAIRQKKETKSAQIGKEEIKLYF